MKTRIYAAPAVNGLMRYSLNQLTQLTDRAYQLNIYAAPAVKGQRASFPYRPVYNLFKNQRSLGRYQGPQVRLNVIKTKLPALKHKTKLYALNNDRKSS